MTELSEKEQLYLNVGKCLSLWNNIEAELLNLVSYAASLDGKGNAAVRVGYWAIISFEARLKMCDAMLKARLHKPKYDGLPDRWNTLKNKLIEKARKRAELAHGSVVTFSVTGDETPPTHLFIPAFHRKIDELIIPDQDGSFKTVDADTFYSISIADMQSKARSFRKLREDLNRFLFELLRIDGESAKATE